MRMSPWQETSTRYLPIGRRNDLDHVVRREAIELTEKLKHGPLHLAITGLVTTEPLGTDGIDLVDEEDGTLAGAVLDLLLGQIEGIADELGTVADEHLHELRSRELEEDGIGLVGTGPGQQGLAGTGRSVKEDALGRADADGIEHVLVRHGEDDGLDELLNLLVGTADVGILLGRPLVDLHGLDAGVEFGGELLEDEVGVLVGAHQIGGFEVVHLDEAGNGKVDGLSGRCADDGALGLAGSIGVGGGTLLVGLLGFKAWVDANTLEEKETFRLVSGINNNQ